MTGTTERRRRPGRKPPPLRIWPKQSIASKLGSRRRRYEVTAEEALLAVLLEEGNHLRVPSLVGVQRFLSGADGVEQLELEVRHDLIVPLQQKLDRDLCSSPRT
jgi:hypothetical protein